LARRSLFSTIICAGATASSAPGRVRPSMRSRRAARSSTSGPSQASSAGLPKSRKLSAAEIARIKQECAETLIPAREAAADILALERKLSDLVNAAYGLTPEEVALMWRTAPKRMPLDPTEELRRLALPS
jgi:hypothetical protein